MEKIKKLQSDELDEEVLSLTTERRESRKESEIRSIQTSKYNLTQKIYFVYICIWTLINCICESIMGVIFPPEATEKGMSETVIGFVFSIYALMICISALSYGIIIPKFGVRPIFILGIGLTGICNICFGTLHYVQDTTTFITLSLIIKGLEGFSVCAVLNTRDVSITGLFSKQIAFTRGIAEIFSGIGYGIGPVMGGYLSEVGDFSLPYYTIGLVLLSTAFSGVYLLPKADEADVEKFERNPRKTVLLNLLKIPRIIISCLIVIFAGTYWNALNATLEPHLRQFEMSPTLVGTVFLVWSSTYSLLCPLWGWLTDKLSTYWWLITLALLLNAINTIFLGPSLIAPFIKNSIWINILVLFINGLLMGVIYVPSFNATLDAAFESDFENNEATCSLVTGLWVFSFHLGSVIGPILGGFILDHWNFPTVSTVLCGVNSIFFLISLLHFWKKTSRRVREE